MDNSKKFVIRCRAVIMHKGRLLVVKHHHNTAVAALPGGHVEWGESMHECLVREIMEELGIIPVVGRLLYVNTFTDGDRIQPVEFFFEVTNGHEYQNVEELRGTHTHELADILWVHPADGVEILPRQLSTDFQEGNVLSDTPRYIVG